jgi:hypothetical protein
VTAKHELPTRLRLACDTIRRTSMPIRDLVPMMHEAADAIQRLEAENEALSQEQERALRLADDAAQSVVCTEGQGQTAYHWFLTHDQIAADPYLEDCIAHLVWRGIAHRLDAYDGVQVVFNEEPW